ncbi:MAG: hypothetical protein EAZ24_14810, partial [Burkholderiales bacterium]
MPAVCHRSAVVAIALAIAPLAVHAACPFSVLHSGAAASPRDGLHLAQFARTQTLPAGASAHVAKHITQLDINADGIYDASDSLIIARAIAGYRGAALVAGIPARGSRSNGTAIQSFIDGGCAADTASGTKWGSTALTESSGAIRNPERG